MPIDPFRNMPIETTIVALLFLVYSIWVFVIPIKLFYKLKELTGNKRLADDWIGVDGPRVRAVLAAAFTNKHDKFKKDKGLMALIWQVRIATVLAVIWIILFINNFFGLIRINY